MCPCKQLWDNTSTVRVKCTIMRMETLFYVLLYQFKYFYTTPYSRVYAANYKKRPKIQVAQYKCIFEMSIKIFILFLSHFLQYVHFSAKYWVK